MRILYIHDQKKIRTGAHQLNSLLVTQLKRMGHHVDTLYPRESINLFATNLKSINSILFFYSLIRKKQHIQHYDLIQGTTYTTLAFLENGVPVISHFGSTTYGFLKNVPSFHNLTRENKQLTKIYHLLKKEGIVEKLNPDLKALKDISEIEMFTAYKSDAVIATSLNVKQELMAKKVPEEKIKVIHNAIEDFWFKSKIIKSVKAKAELIYLGRMGDDAFTIKLKGINRLIFILNSFPDLKKLVIGMSFKKADLLQKVFSKISRTLIYLNLKKKLIPKILSRHYGDIYINTGRYEGFCLSLTEAMSQGLIPIIFPIGVAPEIIQDGKNGYVVNNLAEMQEKIKYLVNKKTLRAKMAEAAIKTSHSFKPALIVKQYLNVYKELQKKEEPWWQSFIENYKS